MWSGVGTAGGHFQTWVRVVLGDVSGAQSLFFLCSSCSKGELVTEDQRDTEASGYDLHCLHFLWNLEDW